MIMHTMYLISYKRAVEIFLEWRGIYSYVAYKFVTLQKGINEALF